MKLNASGNSGVIRCISDLQKPCVSKRAGLRLRVKDTSRSLCYPVLCGHCLPSCQAERQAPGRLVELQAQGERYTTYVLLVLTNPKFQLILLYDQPFSRYRTFYNCPFTTMLNTPKRTPPPPKKKKKIPKSQNFMFLNVCPVC